LCICGWLLMVLPLRNLEGRIHSVAFPPFLAGAQGKVSGAIKKLQETGQSAVGEKRSGVPDAQPVPRETHALAQQHGYKGAPRMGWTECDVGHLSLRRPATADSLTVIGNILHFFCETCRFFYTLP
jgi:hypothetical protein